MMLSFLDTWWYLHIASQQVKFLFHNELWKSAPGALMSRFTLSPKGEFRIKECNQQLQDAVGFTHGALLAPSKEVCSEEP